VAAQSNHVHELTQMRRAAITGLEDLNVPGSLGRAGYALFLQKTRGTGARKYFFSSLQYRIDAE